MSLVIVVIVCGLLGFAIAANLMGSKSARDIGKRERSGSGTPHAKSTSSEAAEDLGHPEDPFAYWEKPVADSWETVLGVAAGASSNDIRIAYRKLTKQYHPDRLTSAAPEILRYAEQRMKSINAAYSMAQRLKRA